MNGTLADRPFLSKKTGTCVKGLAALCVILSHYCSSCPGYCPWYVAALFPGQIWAGLFFFFSGYGLQYGLRRRPDYLTGFIRTRLLPTWLPFCLAELLYGLLDADGLSLTALLAGMIGLRLLNTVLWYVVEILALYLLFYMIHSTLRRDWVWLPLYAAFVVLCAAKDVASWWYISTSAFLMGIYAEKLQTRLPPPGGFVFAADAALTLALYVLRVALLMGFLSLPPSLPLRRILVGLDMLTVPCFVMAWLLCPCRLTADSPPLSFLGEISYEIYLLHMPAALLVKRITDRNALFFPGAMALTIGASWLFHALYRPVRRRLQKR